MASSTQTRINIDVNVNASSGTDAEPEVDFSFYFPLFRATLRGDWDAASAFFNRYPDALEARIAPTLETALHIAVAKTSRSGIHFVEKLIDRMSPEALALTSSRDGTALATAARLGNVEAAMLLVRMNPELPLIRDSSNAVPLHRAAQFGHRQMLVYLLEVTKDDVEPSPFVGESGVLIIRHIIFAEFYDLALDLVQRYPALATFDGNVAISPLATIAAMPSAFPKGFSRKGWWWFAYFWIFADPFSDMSGISADPFSDRLFDGATVSYLGILRQMQTSNNLLHDLAKICSTKANISINWVQQWRYVRDLKNKYRQSLQLVKFLCKEAAKLDHKRVESIMRTPLFYAVSNGIHEIVEEIVEAFPPAIWWSTDDENCHNIFHSSVFYRRSTVFNLLYQMDQPTSLTTFQDRFGNNLLHVAGKLAPSHRLNIVAGAALQMQSELLWFKEVEKFVPSTFKKEVNNEMKTPAMVFTEEHKELLIKGEKWMKDTAKSCSLVAALIATVMFAATITVPGGSNNSTGFPVFRTEKAFVIFTAYNALSLLSSIVSIIVFLSILTARYAESDFLYALPNRLVIGHFTLYLSIAFMMGAFCAALYLVYGDNNASVLAALVAYGSIPIILLWHLQRPIIDDMIKLTVGPGLFGKKSERPFY